MNNNGQCGVKSRTILRSAVLATLVLASACSSDSFSPENIGSSENELFFASGAATWGPTVPVCFNSGFTQAQMDRIRTSIEEEWNRVAAVSFRFDGLCPSSPGSGTVVVQINTTLGSLGLSTVGKQSSNWIAFKSGLPSLHTLLHEFGHTLGFTHEHNDDGTCNSRTSDQLVSPQSDPTTSIMSQSGCNSATRLSPNDVVGVQRIYGRKATGSMPGLGAKCVQVAGSSLTPGAILTAQDCNAGIQGSLWSHTSTGQLYTNVFAQNGAGGAGGVAFAELCARVSGGTVNPNGATALVTGDCAGAAAFDLTDMQVKGFGGLCMAATSSSVGATLESRTCARTSPMLWSVQNLGSAQKKFVHIASGLCVQIGGASLGDAPTLQTCSSSTRQRFNFNRGGIYPAGQTAFCFNVFGGLPGANSQIGLWDGCNGVENSFFYGSGRLKTQGHCLNMFGGVAFNGVQVGTYPCQSPATTNEIWDFRF